MCRHDGNNRERERESKLNTEGGFSLFPDKLQIVQ